MGGMACVKVWVVGKNGITAAVYLEPSSSSLHVTDTPQRMDLEPNHWPNRERVIQPVVTCILVSATYFPRRGQQSYTHTGHRWAGSLHRWPDHPIRPTPWSNLVTLRRGPTWRSAKKASKMLSKLVVDSFHSRSTSRCER